MPTIHLTRMTFSDGPYFIAEQAESRVLMSHLAGIAAVNEERLKEIETLALAHGWDVHITGEAHDEWITNNPETVKGLNL